MLRDIAEVAEFNAVWDSWVADITPPSRACFVPMLANPDLKIETTMVCAAAPATA
jgi:enamine deaminase RidA (YjgF/YER057c/UK114 family)